MSRLVSMLPDIFFNYPYETFKETSYLFKTLYISKMCTFLQVRNSGYKKFHNPILCIKLSLWYILYQKCSVNHRFLHWKFFSFLLHRNYMRKKFWQVFMAKEDVIWKKNLVALECISFWKLDKNSLHNSFFAFGKCIASGLHLKFQSLNVNFDVAIHVTKYFGILTFHLDRGVEI